MGQTGLTRPSRRGGRRASSARLAMNYDLWMRGEESRGAKLHKSRGQSPSRAHYVCWGNGLGHAGQATSAKCGWPGRLGLWWTQNQVQGAKNAIWESMDLNDTPRQVHGSTVHLTPKNVTHIILRMHRIKQQEHWNNYLYHSNNQESTLGSRIYYILIKYKWRVLNERYNEH
jgi:hypothetical protein